MKVITVCLILYSAAICFAQNENDSIFLIAEICVREIPESLVINQETTRENGIEYSWQAAILSKDGKCIYSLEANHHKAPLAKPEKVAIDKATLVLLAEVSQGKENRDNTEMIYYDANAISPPYRLNIQDSCFVLAVPVSSDIILAMKRHSFLRVFFASVAIIAGEESQDVSDTTLVGLWIDDPIEPNLNGMTDIIRARLRIVEDLE